MINIAAAIMAAGNIRWQSTEHPLRASEDAISINFHFHRKYDEDECFSKIAEALNGNGIEWLRWDKKYWIFSSEKAKEFLGHLAQEDWLHGNLVLSPQLRHEANETFLRFEIHSADVAMQMMTRIFLSHKGVDKEVVRRFKRVLASFNYKPWLDEDDMKAGDELERSLLKGFSDSCAAVFFVTPNYKDEGFLATEVNYALQEKRNKKERFSIITLSLPDEDGNLGEVPQLLRQYVWKEPKTEMEALIEIVNSLPIESPIPVWKSHA